MKRLVLFCGIFALSASYFTPTSNAQGCVDCQSGSDECQRVITHGTDRDGNPTTTVHIFHGDPQPCAEQ